MSAILFDLDGVLYESDRAIDGATDTINWFNKNHTPHLFLTNTTSKSRLELVTKLAGFGIKSKIEDFLTPPVAAKQWLQKNNISNIALFAPKKTREEFSDFNLLDNETKHVGAVVVGDMGEHWTFAIMNKVFRTLINNPQAGLSLLGEKKDVVMIGDDIHGDVEAAQHAGLKAILVRTGKFSAADLRACITDDAILDSVASLPEWWQLNMQTVQHILI